MKDPVRLLTQGSSDVQALLRAAKADAPSPAQLGHLAAKLAPTIAAPVSGVLLPWLLAGVTVLGAAGVVVVARDRLHAQREQPAAVAAPAPSTSQPETPMPSVAIVSPDTTAPATHDSSEPMKHVAKTLEPARQPPPPVPRELELLTAAQAALRAHDFARALALADRHAGLYATGTFAEEREAIAIEAMCGLGQQDRARSRLTAFTARYAHSGYRARLERSVRE